MRVLVVGAGAVGQTLGGALARAGAAVELLVKPGQARGALTLYDLGRGGLAAPLAWTPLGVHEAPPARGDWDFVLVAVPTPALRAGSALWRALARAAKPSTVWVGFTPGIGDEDFLRRCVEAPPARVVWGAFSMVAYPSRDGVAFWQPPRSRLAWAGDAAERWGARLAAGGLRARVDADARRQLAFSAPLLDVHVAALELAGWRLAALARDAPLRRLAAAATAEALAVRGRLEGVAPPRALGWLGPGVVGLALRGLARFAGALAPFDLEAYLRAHFTKVGAQTRATLAEHARLAAAHGLPSAALSALGARLQPG